MKSLLSPFTTTLLILAATPGDAEMMQGFDDVPAGAYTVDTKETLVRYEVLHFGSSDYWGTFPGATGTMKLDPRNLGATQLEIKVPVATVETTNRELDGELFSDEFFDGETYPYLSFLATAVKRTGPRTMAISGKLSMHNVTMPVVLDATFIGGGPSPFDSKEIIIGFRATASVKRSAFGLGKYVPIVSDATNIVISVAFKKT
ncbi:MAG TPA: YceI family protein [Steroidobacteraceae bacterium]|jgi:polyisoprenoid-binding protein YceI|nr:YceI family protein [Steroidobacteraceae bacterium]